jgi:N-acetylglutamate synthase/N-acetylornithine aminotransferase
VSRKHLAAGGGRGILVNSGQANAATGNLSYGYVRINGEHTT